MRAILRTFTGLVLYASVSTACPLCHTPTGQQVRAGIFNESFGQNLLLTMAPFLVLAIILLAMHFGFRPRAVRRPGVSNWSDE